MAIYHRHRSGLILPQSVPVGPIEIDWTHPLANGLVSAYVPGAGNGLVDYAGKGRTLVNAGGGFPAVGSAGQGWQGTGTNGYASATVTATQLAAAVAAQTTILHLFTFVQAPSVNSGTGIVSSSFAGVVGLRVTTASLQGWSWTTSGTATFATPLVAGTAYSAVITQAANNGVGYLNGIQRVSVSGAGTPPNITADLFAIDAPTTGGSAGMGITHAVYQWSRPLSASEAVWLNADPFAFFRPVARRVFKGVSDVSVALVGVVGTASVGAFTPTVDVPLTGLAGTASVGAFVSGVSVSLIGVSGTAAVGSFTSAISVSLAGVSGTAAVGSFTPAVDVPLTGVSGTASVGSFDPAVLVPLTGVSGTAAVGSFSAGVSFPLVGVVGTAAVGSFDVGVAVPIYGPGWPGISLYQTWYVPPRSVGGVIYFEPPDPTGVDWEVWAAWLQNAIVQMEIGITLPPIPTEDLWRIWLDEMVLSSRILQLLNVPRPEYVPTWQAWGLYLQQLI